MHYIPYGRQSIDQEDIDLVVSVLQSDYLTTGPKINEFEQRVAGYVGARYAVAVNSGTAALHIACLAAGIKEKDEVVTSPITFAASANCVLYVGGVPVFADIDKDTYNISPDGIEEKITERTKALIPVHFAGQPCDMDRIGEIAKKHGLIVIEDAAHALGASYKGRMVGSISDMTCFSFHPVKPITTGEGGMVVTNNEELYKRLLLFRSHGITRDDNMLEKNEGDWYYEQLTLGYNYRITDIGCALGLSQMGKLDQFLSLRRRMVQKYEDAFLHCEEIVTPSYEDINTSGWHLYVIQIRSKNRKAVFDALRKSGIGVNVHYLPVYKHPYYQTHGYNKTVCPNAEQYYDRAITLPLYPGLTEEEQDYVIKCVLQCVSS